MRMRRMGDASPFSRSLYLLAGRVLVGTPPKKISARGIFCARVSVQFIGRSINDVRLIRIIGEAPGGVLFHPQPHRFGIQRVRAQNLFESLTLTSRYMYRLAAEIHQTRRL
jgi:hypothetical protein